MDFDLSNPLGVIQQSVQQNNEWSAAQAQKQMDFQKMMSDTAHQRQVADLKAAGLNPVLSAHTQGASTPSGASAQADTSGTMALMDLMSQMIESQTALGLAAARGSSGGGGYGYGSNLIQRNNYSRNPLLSMLQDVFEDRYGISLAHGANQALDYFLGDSGALAFLDQMFGRSGTSSKTNTSNPRVVVIDRGGSRSITGLDHGDTSDLARMIFDPSTSHHSGSFAGGSSSGSPFARVNRVSSRGRLSFTR